MDDFVMDKCICKFAFECVSLFFRSNQRLFVASQAYFGKHRRHQEFRNELDNPSAKIGALIAHTDKHDYHRQTLWRAA